MQSFCRAGKDGTFLGAGLIANGDYVSEELAGLENIEDRLGLLMGDVDVDFVHGLHRHGIEHAWLEPGALGFEKIAADVIDPRFCHLAARAVVHANEDNFLFHCDRTLDMARAR
jgi:hypothetical protein